MEAVGRLAGGCLSHHDFNNLLTVITCLFLMSCGKWKDHPLGRKAEGITEEGKARPRPNAPPRSPGQLLRLSRSRFLQPRVINSTKPSAGMEKMWACLMAKGTLNLCTLFDPEKRVNGKSRADHGQVETGQSGKGREWLKRALPLPRGGQRSPARLPSCPSMSKKTRSKSRSRVGVSKHGRSQRDTGVGMTDEKRRKIPPIEPFFTTKGVGRRGAPGLGLATCYGIVLPTRWDSSASTASRMRHHL